jgi:hypothetical protein
MSSLTLGRVSSLVNSSATSVILAATNKFKASPMISMEADEHDHHDDNGHMYFPTQQKSSSANSLNSLLIKGNLKVGNSFTSKI